MTTETATVETIPADIACAAMTRIMDGATTVDAVFFAALESTGPCHNEKFAKAYGLSHWAELSHDARSAWDWVFGRESRMPAFLCQAWDEKADRYENAILARDELDD